uniref:Bm10317, isoform a n=1 Tax=Brugia malayi TaxID=6279 RepID=A0A1I9G6Z3_BRUMA|nr:Bm10317, isoform a [Brugia malayi]
MSFFCIQTTLVLLVSTIIFWWGCCNRSLNHLKKTHQRSSDETGINTAPVDNAIRTTKTAPEDAQSPALSKSQSFPRTSSDKSVDATQAETMKFIRQHKGEQDSFATHIPKKRVARRSTEIKARPPVRCDRDDYKTIPAHMLPSSTDDL